MPLVSSRPRRVAGWALLALLLPAAPGCWVPRRLSDSDRYRRGIVYVLPGIEGRSPWNRNIALGLDAGGVRSAIEVYDWTSGLPGGYVYNLADLRRNRREARKLADRIISYRQRYPGAPVHIVGHSAGGGIAVLTLEALPAGRQIDMAILLAPALSRDYDLSTALRRTSFGVCNFYSNKDLGFLKLGTSLFGAVDRNFGYSAGAVGFEQPPGLGRAESQLYDQRLRQVRWTPRLREVGASGGHFGWASSQFATEYLAPLIVAHETMRPTAPRPRPSPPSEPRPAPPSESRP